MCYVMDANDGWNARVETQSGGELVTVPAFSEVTLDNIIQTQNNDTESS